MTTPLAAVEYPGLSGFKVFPLRGDEGLRVLIVDEGGPAFDAAAVETRWRAMCHQNPRLFDGPILSVRAIASRDSMREVSARRSSYKLLAVQNEVQTGTDQLSVTAVVHGSDASGRPHVLLGRRGAGTRIYGGRWELGPSGGIDPPAPGADTLDTEAVHRQVHEEVREEMGGDLNVRTDALVAMTYDPIARSYDFVIRCTALVPVTAAATGTKTWEYHGALWLPIDECPVFDREHAAEIIGPTRALFRHFGWVAPSD